jgi:putative lipoic acid-binding regulatory protein
LQINYIYQYNSSKIILRVIFAQKAILSSKSNEFYKKLELRLEETSDWPSEYVFKFIVPTEQEKIDKISSLFNHSGAVINTKQSSKGKYTSLSIRLEMESPEHIIKKYKLVGYQIDGVISL